MHRILVADDDHDVLGLLKATLTFRGFQVIEAVNGSQAMALIEREVPDAAVLDWGMPGMDGIAVVRQMRGNPKTSRIPVIFLTGRDDITDRIAGFEAGIDDYLIKPFQPRELIRRLEALLAPSPPQAGDSPPVSSPAPRLPHVESARALPPEPIGGRSTTVAPSLWPSGDAPAQEFLPASDSNGIVVAVLGSKGGVGTSLLAANLGVGLAVAGTKAVLLDLDLTHAYTASLLDLVPFRDGTLAELSTSFDSGPIEPEMLQNCILPHKSGLKVIVGTHSPAYAELVKGEHVKVYLELLRDTFSHIVVDLNSGFDEVALDTLSVLDLLLFVVTPDVPSLKSFRAMVDIIKQLGVPERRIQVVVSMPHGPSNISVDDIRRTVKLPVIAVIPTGGEEFRTAQNRGMPFVIHKPLHPVGQAYRKLADQIAVWGKPKPRR